MVVFRLVLMICLTSFCIECVDAQTSTKPNVIYILGDDIGYDVLTVNGGQSFSTPNLDSMARNGMNFTHCEATPMCSPTRMMLLTGKQNYRNYSNWGYLSDTAKTMANLMKDAGYTTAIFGKHQLQSSPALMKNWGWDKYTIFEITDDSMKNIRRYKTPNLVDNNGRVPESVVKDKYCDDILTSRVLGFIDSNKNKPFFIYYSMSIGHEPFCPTPDDAEFALWDPNSNNSNAVFFPSMVKYMDKKVGEILTKLRKAGLDTNTIVFYAGDNGTPNQINYKANGAKVQGQKTLLREGGTHVPLIAYWPKHIARRSINDDLIDFADFFPTFANIAGYKNLGKYGVLDGISFYNRLLKKPETARTYIFTHYNPRPGFNELNRWVRDKEYKLYDSTGTFKSGKFFNIKTDKEEEHALSTGQLTAQEASIKAKFKDILDNTATWPDAPLVENASASRITSNSVTLTATIVNSGASNLTQRGSTLSRYHSAYFDDDRQTTAGVKLGTFSVKRTDLQAQTAYYYSLFGMNANASHNTGFASGTIITLSNAPLQQPTSLTATDISCSVKVSWNNASYPTKGATRGGYILLYSTKAIALSTAANGKEPAALCSDPKCRRVNLSAPLPALPFTSTNVGGLSKDSLYYFKLVPYTWDGSRDSTYNYLTASALSTTKKPANNGCKGISDADLQSITTVTPLKMSIAPNPSNSIFTLQLDKAYTNNWISVRVSDAAGKTCYKMEGKGRSQYSFGSDLRAGVYFVYIESAQISYTFKIVKNQ